MGVKWPHGKAGKRTVDEEVGYSTGSIPVKTVAWLMLSSDVV